MVERLEMEVIEEDECMEAGSVKFGLVTMCGIKAKLEHPWIYLSKNEVESLDEMQAWESRREG